MKILLLMSLIAKLAFSQTKTIAIDGSNTVFPISEGIAEDYAKKEKKVRVTVGSAGTGAGFKKFINGEIPICAASRPVSASEQKDLADKKVEFIELPIAYDGLSVVVNKKNKFIESISIAELKKIWEPDSKVKLWSDVNSAYPKKPIKLFGPSADHGTFDYFTEKVNGKSKVIRKDFSASDNNGVVRGVSGEEFALGYFGHAYAQQNSATLKILKINSGKVSIAPSVDTIRDQSYPFSRLLFIYINKKAFDADADLRGLLDFYLANVGRIAKSPTVGYVDLTSDEIKRVEAKLKAKTTGSTGKI